MALQIIISNLVRIYQCQSITQGLRSNHRYKEKVKLHNNEKKVIDGHCRRLYLYYWEQRNLLKQLLRTAQQQRDEVRPNPVHNLLHQEC